MSDTTPRLSKLWLVLRLAVRDLQHRPGQAVMLAVIMAAATAALTLGLVLHGTTAHPYQTTREATAGPDAVATDFPSGPGAAAGPAALRQTVPLAHAAGVTGHSGPLPVAFPVLSFDGHSDAVLAEGRGSTAAAVDQPKLIEGRWIRPGAVVIERSFADALGIHAGDRITLDGRPFTVAGVAVTAAFPDNGLGFLEGSSRWPNPGLVWTTEAAAHSLATRQHPLGYVLNLRLASTEAAEGFADRFDPGGYTDNTGGLYVIPWQMISRQDGLLMAHEQKILLVGSWLLALLAIGSLAIVAGGRMAEQNRRVGLLKAAGRDTRARRGGAAGRIPRARGHRGRGGPGHRPARGAPAHQPRRQPARHRRSAAADPARRRAGAGGRAGHRGAGQLCPGAARCSHQHRGRARRRGPPAPPPRSAHHLLRPPPRAAAARGAPGRRRPRRVLLGSLSIAVTVSGIVAILFAHATLTVSPSGNAAAANPGLSDVGFISQTARENQVLLIITVMLATLAAVNIVCITWATVQDSRHTAAITRALGARIGHRLLLFG